MSQNINYKFVLVGDSAVGKSCVATRYINNNFYEFQEPTIGAAFLAKKLNINNKKIKIELWDTAGQERYRSLAPMYYRNASGALIIYDVTQKISFEGAKSWVEEILRKGAPNCIIALLGNKFDLKDEIKVTDNDINEYVSRHNLIHYYTSAKTGENINKVFENIINKLLEDNNIGLKSNNLKINKTIKSNTCC